MNYLFPIILFFTLILATEVIREEAEAGPEVPSPDAMAADTGGPGGITVGGGTLLRHRERVARAKKVLCG